jgi:phosphoglycerol transferase MdoB-like AlkP superfamily enzyme
MSLTVFDALSWITAIVFLGFAAVVLWKLYHMDLSHLVCELDDTKGARKASLSRFQFLLFTFVIAGAYLALCLEAKTFVDVPAGALGLIGISGGSFVLSKGLSKG